MPKLREFYINYPDIEIDLGTDFEAVTRNTRRCDFAILWGDGYWPSLLCGAITARYILGGLYS